MENCTNCKKNIGPYDLFRTIAERIICLNCYQDQKILKKHWHSEQMHTERQIDSNTGIITIISYCLKCGEPLFKTQLKDQ